MPNQNLSLADIEALTADYARARTELKTHVDRGNAEREALENRFRPMLRRRAVRCAALAASLKATIDANPHLFEKPRTHTWHGVRVGLFKQKGQVIAADEARTIALIERHYPEQATSVVKTTKRLVKESLREWTAVMLKRCGLAIGAATDKVLIRPVDSQLEKDVKRWLEEPNKEEAA